MKHEPLFRGSAVALVTPLRGGKVDVEALHRLVETHVDNGTAAIVACGTTGEPATLTPDERELVIREVVAAARGRVPVICGTGSNCTQTVIDTERRYRGLGCVAQLVVTPYYNKTTQEGLYAHFMAIAEHTELPIVLYNVPGRTGLDIAPETIDRLAESGRFVALKESSYDLPRVMEKISAMRGRLTLYSGNDDMIYPLLALGAEGVISVLANVAPAYVSGMTGAYFSGKTEKALHHADRMPAAGARPVQRGQPHPLQVRHGTAGLCGGELRLPLIGAGENTRRKLREALVQMGILIA